MKRILGGLFLLTVGVIAVLYAQPPGGGKKGPKGKGPPGFHLGKVLPPHIMEEIELSEDQLDKLAELEKDVKSRLEKILTEKQRRQIESLRDRGPKGKDDDEGPPRKGKGKGKDDRPKNEGNEGRKERPPFEDDSTAKGAGGIQWFATLERGLEEARLTGRPILFLAAAPHCAGVSGIW